MWRCPGGLATLRHCKTVGGGGVLAEKISSPGDPGWTELQERQGLDPLGMQNTSIALYQSMLPGISNVTLRVRYYAFHSWVCREYARAHHSPNTDQWCLFLRRCEALYALVAQQHAQATGVAGSRWASNTLKGLKGDRIRFAVNADRQGSAQYLLQKFGAFGAAYSSQMSVLGLLQEAEKHDLPVASTRGTKLANDFAASVGSAAAVFLDAVRRGSVTLGELRQLGVFAPSHIEAESDERATYEALLFAPQAGSDTLDASRRSSLRLLLYAAGALGRTPDAQEVRWMAYSGFDDEGNPLPPLPGADAACRYRWRVYHANDLMHVCHEALLRFTLEALERHPNGVRTEALLDEVASRLIEAAEDAPATWGELEASLEVPENAWGEDEGNEWFLADNLLSRRVEEALPAKMAFDALRLLATLARRFEPELGAVQQVLHGIAHDTSQTVVTELRFLARHRDAPLKATIAALVKQRILDRHQLVAFQKLRGGDYTFLFEVEDGLVRPRSKAGPVFTNPRLRSAISFLTDIHLLGVDGLTAHGRQVLEAA